MRLLEFPSETLSVEYKSWLDLGQNPGKATLAKAAIALANEGGGVIVLGMRENNDEGGALVSKARPADLGRYSQDDINAAINRYSDPEFHCGLMFANHPATHHEHAFVVVPGGMTVPVMSRRGCDGVINPYRCYVRKAGPRSEEAMTAEEWRPLLERCIQARRESMLDAIRVIVQGHGTPAPTEAVRNALTEFSNGARARWEELIADLPSDDSARMPHGHYEIEIELIGVGPANGTTETLRRMQIASQIKHTGWGPFVLLTRPEFAPVPIAGNVEAWLGRPVEGRFSRDPAHCDFWRVHPSGLLFLLRGYDEDGEDSLGTQRAIPPGTIVDITLPIWRVGEVMLYASRLAQQFDQGGNPDILVRCKYVGLRGRRLDYLTPGRYISVERICHDNTVEIQAQATATQMDENLVEVLHPMLAPLYERFDFYELSIALVRSEIERMRRSRF